MNVHLLTGREALDCLESSQFHAEWTSLHARCPWATACQHPDFVAPWFQFYGASHAPVVVLARGSDGGLAGLFTLALRRQDKTITAAGAQQAEYQAWLALPGDHNAFVRAAVRAVRAGFPGHDLYLKYLLPEAPLDWIDEERDYRHLCSVRRHARPVMRIDAAAMGKQRNKKNHRQNHNRLKRMGEVQFEKLIEHERFVALFDHMCMQYDFRQAALYHRMPFTNDSAKKPFHIELHRRGLLHTTVLMVGSEIAASHFGLASHGRAVHIGIMTHGPAYAPHSPGNLLLAMLGVQLAQENMPMLDLTPGGDGYKEHFATEHDEVAELTIYGDTARRMKGETMLELKRLSKAGLHKAGYRTAHVLAALDWARTLKASGLQGLRGKLRPGPAARPCALRYQWKAPAGAGAVHAAAMPVSRNRLDDVFKFDAGAASMSGWEFMVTVMKRMERSHHLYSLVRDDKLVLCCWMRLDGDAPAAAATGQGAAMPDSAVVLSDLYVHRRLADDALVQAFIRQVVHEVAGATPGSRVYYRGDLDAGMRRVVESCGFVDAAQVGGS